MWYFSKHTEAAPSLQPPKPLHRATYRVMLLETSAVVSSLIQLMPKIKATKIETKYRAKGTSEIKRYKRAR
jgi:hypothetical protein